MSSTTNRPKPIRPNPARLALPAAALTQLKEAGIDCAPEVTLEYQKTANRYVLRGRESGGADLSIGRYVGFCGADGTRVPWSLRPDSLTPNTDHAVVVAAPALISVEMFRYQQTYELLIVRHSIHEPDRGRRPNTSTQTLFRGWQGQLPLDLAGADKALLGTIAPEFFDRSCEPNPIPAAFIAIVNAVTAGVNCVSCSHVHALLPKTTEHKSSEEPPVSEAPPAAAVA